MENSNHINSNRKSGLGRWNFIFWVLLILLILTLLARFGIFGENLANKFACGAKEDNTDYIGQINSLKTQNNTIPGLNTKISDLTKQVGIIPGLRTRIAELEKKPDAAPARNAVSPVLDVMGSNPLQLDVGTAYNDPGVKATDDVDGNINVVTTGSVNYNQAGSYDIVYTATDSSGNVATSARRVNVVTPQAPVSAAPQGMAQARVFFDLNSYNVNSKGMLYLSPVINYMNANSSSTVRLSGFHDPSGNPAANTILANNRANQVKQALNNAGISSSRITISQPSVTTGTGAPAEARRVELYLNQ